MKKSLLLIPIIFLIGITTATDSFPAFPMTIHGETNLNGGTLIVYDGTNSKIADYEIREDGTYGSENAFVMPLTLNSFTGKLTFKAKSNGRNYVISKIDDSYNGENCPNGKKITFVSEKCRYDLIFKQKKRGSSTTGTIYTGEVEDDGDIIDPEFEHFAGDDEDLDPQEMMSNGYTREFNDAYEFAYKNGITTMRNIHQADMNGKLDRIAMAKMLSQYAINILKKVPDTTKICSFQDVSKDLDEQYNNGVTLACQLGIMGIGIDEFRPFDTVIRGEFGTALSRMLYNTIDGIDKYYSTHLKKLNELGIINNTDPELQELRGYVMLMLMRSAK